jgi:hypothetical protein
MSFDYVVGLFVIFGVIGTAVWFAYKVATHQKDLE